MNTLTMFNNRRWSPFREMDALSNLFFGDRVFTGPGASNSIELRDWSPLVDITESDNEYLVKAELPEVAREDIAVRVEDGVLSLSGERKAEVVKDEEKIHRVERAYGKFTRTFRVPENADGAKATANYKGGVLRVVLPKVAAAKPKTVEINVA
ncbi:MAG: Spore protein SP21 [Verrucomicrobia subdivision 3 bacterium]|nr:Spore protein SP21 [Limisphaerales bacterium]MCS1416946.1 Spore protein SP21 [Limisphaerales bacterium]